MNPFRSLTDKTKLVTVIWLLLSIGFFATTVVSYVVSRDSIRDAILATELPLTSDNVYSEIQKDLVRPILISSMMSRDTFLRDWVVGGERDAAQMTRYLKEVMSHYGAVTSFFVSEKSRTYHSPNGPLKKVREDEHRDEWYFRVSKMSEPYEINVDPDLANRDALTIFINYRVFDYQQRFIGATGVGLTVDEVNRMIDDYQQRYGRTIYLVDGAGKITLSGRHGAEIAGRATSIRDIEGLRDQADAILKAGQGSFEYRRGDQRHFVNVRYIPELKWHLFVDKREDRALNEVQQAFYLNLLVCALITAVVLLIVYFTINHYQNRLEKLATTDNLTGLSNRHSLDLLLEQVMREATRQRMPMAAIILDIDHFKKLNDHWGHLAGDYILACVAADLKQSLRSSDIACRWGGEEFLIILSNTQLAAAVTVADNLRSFIGRQIYEFSGQPLGVTVSMGVAAYRNGETQESLIGRADEQLYRAKNQGRNRVCSDGEVVEVAEFAKVATLPSADSTVNSA